MKQATLTGRVYVQQNGLQKGIAGVSISNGELVVETDANGRYTLPLPEAEGVIFLTKPAEYELPLNGYNQPQFFHFIRPEGSPNNTELEHEGFAPTPLPETVDFELLPGKKQDRFRTVFFGDIQPKTEEEVGFFQQLMVQHLIHQPMDFFVPLGDIAWDGLALYPQLREALSGIGKPYYTVCGNHDINLKASDPAFSRETFQRYFVPTYYAFDYGEVHFVVLDDIGYTGWDKANNTSGITQGYLSDRQLDWLRNDLATVAEDKLVVLLMHIPIYTDILPADTYRNIQNRDDLFDTLSHRKKVLALAAHTHFVEHVDLRNAGWSGDGIFQHLVCGAACGAWWKGPRGWSGLPVRLGMDGTPNGFWVFDFDGNTYNYRFQAAGLPAHEQVGLRAPMNGTLSACTDGEEVVANIYAASYEAVVTCQIDDSVPLPMERTVVKDPLVLYFLEQYADDYTHWIKPRDCAHLWKAPLPDDLEPGVHTLTVLALEPDGRRTTGKHSFSFGDRNE
jgi:3',5'-cyclic AMP phosphodiesterase CpdA